METKIRLSSSTPLSQLEKLNANKGVSDPVFFFPTNHTDVEKSRSNKCIKHKQISAFLSSLFFRQRRALSYGLKHRQAATLPPEIETYGKAYLIANKVMTIRGVRIENEGSNKEHLMKMRGEDRENLKYTKTKKTHNFAIEGNAKIEKHCFEVANKETLPFYVNKA